MTQAQFLDTQRDRSVNVLSLFSGIGGLDLGLERAGMTVVGQVEIAPFCQRVLAKHWPEVPRHDDVRTAAEWWLGEPRPAVDVVAGGSPCQPVSLAGRGLAQADERWLWPAAWAVIRDLRPAWAVLENVPGLLARGLGDVLGDLATIGYDAEWDCIPAAAVGAPHRRDRVFVVAYPGGEPRRLQPVAEPRRRNTAVAGHDGPTGDVAYATSGAGDERPHGDDRRATTEGSSLPAHPGGSRLLVANPDGERLEGRRLPEAARRRSVIDLGRGRPRVHWRRPRPSREWAAEPAVGRVAHGLPASVVRAELHALGNAVVPQVAEHIGRLVMAVA